MDFVQELLQLGVMGLLIMLAFWFISVCMFGFVMKHFIREAVKEAMDDCGLSKRKTDETW